MYLTKMELDPAKRRCAMALASPGLFHGAIEDAFRIGDPGEERERKLWRIDELGGKPVLLLLSESKPELSYAAEQFGTEKRWESRSYDSFLHTIHTGDRRRFRLTANPVISKSKGSAGGRGTVFAHVTVAQQEQWLLDRAEKNGFLLKPEEFTVTESKWVSFRKGKDSGRTVSFRAVTFEGVLTVADEGKFRDTLCSGIGKEKAYGCGLLTVLRNEA